MCPVLVDYLNATQSTTLSSSTLEDLLLNICVDQNEFFTLLNVYRFHFPLDISQRLELGQVQVLECDLVVLNDLKQCRSVVICVFGLEFYTPASWVCCCDAVLSWTELWKEICMTWKYKFLRILDVCCVLDRHISDHSPVLSGRSQHTAGGGCFLLQIVYLFITSKDSFEHQFTG